jgi:hypothetical protein
MKIAATLPRALNLATIWVTLVMVLRCQVAQSRSERLDIANVFHAVTDLAKDDVEPFCDGLLFDQTGARHHVRQPHVRSNLAPLGNSLSGDFQEKCILKV